MARSPASPLAAYRDDALTLDDLVAAATRLLRRLDVRPEDGRVADALDPRGVRYYQAIGVIDKPLRYDGRRAIYGYRHLLQLLSAKRLQQEGHPLQLIQRALTGRSTEGLEQALTGMLSVQSDRVNPKVRGLERPNVGDIERRAEGIHADRDGPEARDAERPKVGELQRRPTDSGGSDATPSVAWPAAGMTGAIEEMHKSPGRLVAATVAPGVTVTVDPGIVGDPERVIEMVARALSQG